MTSLLNEKFGIHINFHQIDFIDICAQENLVKIPHTIIYIFCEMLKNLRS